MADRAVSVVVFPGFQTLDAIGPIDVLAGANQLLDLTGRTAPRYRIETVGPTRSVRSETGVTLEVDRTFADRRRSTVDTLLVAGGRGVREAADDEELVGWVGAAASDARRVCSVCTGTFVLAEADLLGGHAVTTHWAWADELAARFPDVDVDAEPIHRRSERVWTSAGVTAGIDLALALVEGDHGAEVAQHIARWFVMFLRRPGGQSQFAAPVWADAAKTEPVRRAQNLVNTAPADDHTVEALARRVGMSARHLTRVFRDEVGVTPARYVERVRVDAARRELELTSVGLVAVADRCGFGSTETMRKAFLRQVGVSPSDYRQRFRTAEPVG